MSDLKHVCFVLNRSGLERMCTLKRMAAYFFQKQMMVRDFSSYRGTIVENVVHLSLSVLFLH